MVVEYGILGVEVVGLAICLVIFAISVTGRVGFDAWETSNLNKVAVISGLAAVGMLVLIWARFSA